MIDTPTTNSVSTNPFSRRRLAIIAIVTAAANLIALAIGTTAGASMIERAPEPTRITAVSVIASSLAPLLVAGAIVWLVARRAPRFRLWAAWIGLAVGLASVPQPFAATRDLASGTTLAVMHLIVGVAWFVALTTSPGSRARLRSVSQSSTTTQENNDASAN